MKIYFKLIYLLFLALFSCGNKETVVNKDVVTSDEHSTEEANQLYRSLHDYMNKGILLGHQDALAYGYILFWRNAWNDEEHYFIPVQGHPAGDNFFEFANNNRILTLKKI